MRGVVLTTILALVLGPVSICAQGLPGPGSILGSDAKMTSRPNLFLGYLFHPQVATFSGRLDPAAIPTPAVLSQTFDIEGIAIGMSQRISLADRAELLLSGRWVLIPVGTDKSIEHFHPAVGGLASRTWKLENNWWWINALAGFKIDSCVTVLAGIRSDHFETLLKTPDPTLNFGVSRVTDEADLHSIQYFPMLGLRFDLPLGPGELRAQAVGSPYVPGSILYGETIGGSGGGAGVRYIIDGKHGGGYFVEAMLDYRVDTDHGFDFGAFMVLTKLRSEIFDAQFSRSVVGAGVTDRRIFNGVLDRTSATIGASLSLSFQLPSL